MLLALATWCMKIAIDVIVMMTPQIQIRANERTEKTTIDDSSPLNNHFTIHHRRRMSRPRLPSSETLSSSKTHRRNSSVICNGKLHSDRSDTIDVMECCFISPKVSGRRSPSGADVISSLRALELIRQLSFDTSMPEIIEIDTPDRESMVASPSTVSKYLPHLLEFECAPPAPPSTPIMVSPPLPPIIGSSRAKSPPMNYVDLHNRNRARSTSFSEMSDSDGYEVDFDGMMMVMDPLPDQQAGQPSRRRLASDQSPYAVSSISSSSFCDDLSFGEREEMLHWYDPAGYNINLGMNHVEASRLEMTEGEFGPPPCPRLSIDSLQEWNMLCEQEGRIINKREYIETALCPTSRPTSIVGDRQYSPHDSVEAEEVHMMVAPSLSASLSYTHTGVPSTISVSSEFHDVDEVSYNNYDADAALSYSLDKSFESSLAGDIVHMHQDKAVTDTAKSPAPTALRKRHRRHRSDGLVILPRARLTLKKRPSHQRVSSLDISLQIIPESPSGQFVERTISAACDKRFEGFDASGAPFNDKPCSTNLLCMHRRFNSDGFLLARHDKAATE